MSNGQQIELNYKQIDSLQKQFQQILVQLAGDQSLVRFKHQYDKLYRALKRSHDNQKILYNKITQLSRDMANQTAKLRLALKLSQQDAQAIAYLKQQLQKTFKVLQISKQRQERAKQKIQAMNSKIKVLQSNLQQFQALSEGQSNAINELKQKKQKLTKEKDDLNDQLTKVKNQLSENYQNLRQVDGQKITIQSTLRSLEKDINEIDEKLRKDQGRKSKIQQQLDNLRRQKDSALGESNKFKDEITKLQQAIKQKQYTLQQSKSEQETIRTQIQQKQHELSKLKYEYITQSQYKTQLNHQNSELDDKMELKRKQLNVTILQTGRLQKEIDKYRNEVVTVRQAMNVCRRQNQMLLNSVPQISRQILDRKKLNNQDKQEIQMLDRERNMLQKQLIKLETQFKQHNEKLLMREKQISANQEKISQGNQTIQGLMKQVTRIQKEKQSYGKKATMANTKYLQTLEEIKLKGNLISQYQKKNIQTENRLKQQQQLYESVRSDRNAHSKNLSQTQDEIAELKRRYKIVNHQINQLKQQIEAKQVALAKEHFQHKKKDQTLLQHSRELQKRKKQMDERREEIKNCFNQISKLHYSIKESQTKRQHRKDQYELIVAERDILGTQLIRRNDESALLYEKIKIQQSTLAKGETAFRQRLADLKLLEYKKQDLKRQLKILMKQGNKIPTLKNQIFTIQSELIQEKLKVKALSEELENPLNVHRCRNLEGTDPDVYEMKEKIKTLQKRLIFKTQQVVQKQVLIHQKEKQIQQLRDIMKKQPGLQVAEQLSILQRGLTTKTSKLKQLAAQINMYQAKTNEYKFDIERTQKEIQQIRRKYNEQKKREIINRQNQKVLQGI